MWKGIILCIGVLQVAMPVFAQSEDPFVGSILEQGALPGANTLVNRVVLPVNYYWTKIVLFKKNGSDWVVDREVIVSNSNSGENVRFIGPISPIPVVGAQFKAKDLGSKPSGTKTWFKYSNIHTYF
jgi:hypothetical protein